MTNSFTAVHPELVSEWSDKNYPLTPDRVTFGSNKKVWWKGFCGHEWQTSVKARSDGEKCPICSGKRVIEGINDLQTLMPEIAFEWSERNELKPTEVSVASHKKVLWRCKHGHEWEAVIKSRTLNKTGCPYCSHNKVLGGYNDLASQFPKIAAEWSDRNLPLKPTMVTAFANSKAWWRCKDCGNEWYTLISTRSGGSKCPYCSGYTLLKGFNDLATTNPDIASEWSERNFPLKPDEVNVKSRKNVWWKCKVCGNEWRSVVSARVKGRVCPVCTDSAVLAGYNDLATTDTYLLSEWDYEKNKRLPTQFSRKSMESVWWKCEFGHSWKAKICDRTLLGQNCKVCENELLSVFPLLVFRYYAVRKDLRVEYGNDSILGVPLEMFLPDENVAIETKQESEPIEMLKNHLCKKREIKLIRMRSVVQEINTEYEQKIDEQKIGKVYDTLEMSGSRAVWKEVLAVYSVKVNTDPDNPQEVATMDDSKKQLLKDMFWEMNSISTRTESKTETQITETDDGHGNIIQTETTVTKTYLYITVSRKTVDEMAQQYGFTQEQKDYLSELLNDENNSLWNSVLYGITTGGGEIVTVALSQIGNVGGQPYWSWYGFGGRVEWCACFVSWCANECGYIDAGVIPKYAGCVQGSQWFKDRGQWADNSVTPEPGMIIFFDWEGDGETDHTGIVEKVENGRVYTVEGNSNDSCKENNYPIGSSLIYGYGCPAY